MKKNTKPIGPLYDGEEHIGLEFTNEIEDDGDYEHGNLDEPFYIRVRADQTLFRILWAICHEINEHITEHSEIEWRHAELDKHARHMARILLNSPRLIEWLHSQICKGR